MKLSSSQKTFLKQHGISIEQVLDATGMKPSAYKPQMSKGDFLVAIGVTPCRAKGHSMRGANGHCIMCKPANLSYRKRHRSTGFVYVAQPTSIKNICKVGIASNIAARQATLNSTQYGGYKDWKIVYHVKVDNMGLLEDVVKRELEPYKHTGYYEKNNKLQEAIEMFACDSSLLIRKLKGLKSKAANIVIDAEVEKAKAESPNNNTKKENTKGSSHLVFKRPPTLPIDQIKPINSQRGKPKIKNKGISQKSHIFAMRSVNINKNQPASDASKSAPITFVKKTPKNNESKATQNTFNASYPNLSSMNTKKSRISSPQSSRIATEVYQRSYQQKQEPPIQASKAEIIEFILKFLAVMVTTGLVVLASEFVFFR